MLRPTVEDSLRLADRAHRGQTDKVGAPYITHVRRVVARLAHAGREARVVGALHDVLEDTPLTAGDLRRAGYSARVVAAVVALTRRKDLGETYAAYIRRLSANPLARVVKLADIADHLESADRWTQRHPAMKRRYLEARAVLLAAEARSGS